MHEAKFWFCDDFVPFPLFMLLCVYITENEDNGSFCDRQTYFPRKLISDCCATHRNSLPHKATFYYVIPHQRKANPYTWHLGQKLPKARTAFSFLQKNSFNLWSSVCDIQTDCGRLLTYRPAFYTVINRKIWKAKRVTCLLIALRQIIIGQPGREMVETDYFMLKKEREFNLLMCKESHCCSSKRNPERSHVSTKAVGTTYELLKDRNWGEERNHLCSSTESRNARRPQGDSRQQI